MNHATVKIGDYTIPLIGIPLSATEMECDLCHDIFHINDVHLMFEGKQFLCQKCRSDIYKCDKAKEHVN
jgi:hypothetical protein